MAKILLLDSDQATLRPLCRFSAPFSLRTGVYSQIQRIKQKFKKVEFVYYHKDAFYEKHISMIEGYLPYHESHSADISEVQDNFKKFGFAALFNSNNINTFQLLAGISDSIEADLGHWKKKHSILEVKKKRQGVYIEGTPKLIYAHKKAVMGPGVVLNTRNGPIILDKGVQVGAFSYLEGPLYVGKYTRLDNVRITGGCSIGKCNRLGGEIENSIIQDFSNKHHEGFLGHSLLGRWVNIGAMATTSDLKNNYGSVRILVPKNRLQFSIRDLESIDSNSIKFGSIIGDCVKIAIGTMINTGSVLDAGSNVFGANPANYVPPLSWGCNGEKYDIDKFIKDTKVIFNRRKQIPHESMIELARELYKAAIADNN